jgi:hypothetical protein
MSKNSITQNKTKNYEELEAKMGEEMAALVAHDYRTNRHLRELKIAANIDYAEKARRGGRPRYGETRADARKRKGLD